MEDDNLLGIKMGELIQLPENYQINLQRAVEVLKEVGCTGIFLFGSLARGKMTEQSDIDLAIQGCPKQRFLSYFG
jgi:predicted nucleotidyltransferase